MASWFSSNKDDNQENSSSQNGGEKALVTVTDEAREKVMALMQNAMTSVLGIRILAEATSPTNPQYSLSFVQEGEQDDEDTVIDVGDFQIFIDPESLPYVKDVELKFSSSGMSGGFRIEKVQLQSELSGPMAERLQKLIDDQINPALAMHGGNVRLINVEDNKAYIELGGGCKGCGMVDVTLKQGIETLIKQNIPEITDILDTTDHASGDNPYYQPSK